MQVKFTSDDNGRIQETRNSFLLAVFGLCLSVLLIMVTITCSIFYPDVFPQRQDFILTPLFLFWFYLLRKAPNEWKQLNDDVNNTSKNS